MIFIHRINFKSWGFLPRVSLVFQELAPMCFCCFLVPVTVPRTGSSSFIYTKWFWQKEEKHLSIHDNKIGILIQVLTPTSKSLILGSLLLTVTRLWYRTGTTTHTHTSVSTLGIPHCYPGSFFSFHATTSILLNMVLHMLELSFNILAKMCMLYPNPNLNTIAALAHQYLWITYNNFKLFFKNKMLAET